MKKLVVVDGSGFIYRAFFALPPLTRSDGTPIGAVFGFTNILISMLTNNSMDYFTIILDKGKKSFRHDIYPEYKQNRRETPPELIPQFKLIRDACNAFEIPIIEEDNYEADDLIASYCKYAHDNGFLVKVVSGDKDLIQLIKDGIELYDPLKAKDITEAEVFKKYGIKPSQMIDFLALCGDAADNIPGVHSVGPKTAANLLNEYQTLENIILNVEKIEKKKKVHEKIIEEQEAARLSKILATTDENAPRNTPLEDLKTHDIDIEKAKRFLEEQEFHSLIPKLNHIKHKKNILNIETFQDIFTSIKASKTICITDNHIKTDDGHEAIIDYNLHKKELIEILENPNILKLTNNSKTLMHITNNLNNFEDIAIMSFLANGKDAPFTVSLNTFQLLSTQLANTKQIEIYNDIEKPLIRIIADIETRGFKADAAKLEHLSDFFAKLLATIKENIFITSGKDINLDSPKQVSELLFNHLNIRYFKRGKRTDVPSTNQSVLEELERAGYEIASHILKWRQISKLKSTYTNALIEKINPVTGRIHTTFNITNTVTGRLSSSDPNLQNIPVKNTIGLKIREAFVAPKGKKLISMDYSQIELRVLAHLSGCEKLLSAFKNNQDIHKITASELFHIPLNDVSDELRRKAKAINFGVIYGMTSFGVSKRINMTTKEATEFIQHYFLKYPEVKLYMDRAIATAYSDGYLTTLLGRRCFIPNISSKNFQIRKFAERQAINAPIQGSSADIMSIAMINIIKCEEITAKMIMQIHDEFIFEVEEEEAEKQAGIIAEIMESVNITTCQLKVNSSIGDNWGQL